VNFNALMMQLLPEAVLVLTALVLLGVALAYESKQRRGFPPVFAIGIATAGILLAFGALVYAKTGVKSGAEALLAVDSFGCLAKGLVLGLGLLAVWLPPARREIAQVGEFYALMLFALTGLLLTTGTNHLLFLFVALELASLSLYLLAGFPRTAKSAEASLKYFLFGGVSAAFMLFGLSFLYGFSNAATLDGIAQALASGKPALLAMAGLLMVLVGLAFKMAAAPFHYWAPDVYQGAPATTVAMVSAASKVVGLVVLVRLLLVGFPAVGGSAAWKEMASGWTVWLAVLSAVSMLFGNLLALAQTSVRRLLAYSAVASTGYLLVPLAANGTKAAGPALFYVFVYGLATLGALAVTAAVERERGDDRISSFAGLVKHRPLLAVALLVCFASLAGIPPLAGFFGKFAMFGTAMAETVGGSKSGLTWLVGLGSVMSAVSLYYYLGVLKQAFVRDAPEGGGDCPCLPVFHVLAIAVPTLLVIILGLFPALLLEPVCKALADLL
jgi:NADH-quinone oxidoreductase subunit N